MSDETSFTRQGAWGVITLTREKALNALTWKMVKEMLCQMREWASDDDVKAILVEGAGEKSFCAGGDVVWIQKNARADPASVVDFFRDEYTLNTYIHNYPKPYVALIDGIVMGGGVGISVHGPYRVAGDRTLFAMPETGIGLVPDVGGGYFLGHMEDGLGQYYGLTGHRAKAADCMSAKIATHYVPTEKQADFKSALYAIDFGSNADADVRAVLDGHAVSAGPAPIDNIREDISDLISSCASANELISKLEASDNKTAQEMLLRIRHMCPTSVAITFEQVKRGGALSFEENMKMELRLVSRIMAGTEFIEGVRALLIDKDKKPNWTPDSISAISQSEINAYFQPIGDKELEL